VFTGRSTARTITVLPDGQILNDRAKSKVRQRERGHDAIERRPRRPRRPSAPIRQRPGELASTGPRRRRRHRRHPRRKLPLRLGARRPVPAPPHRHRSARAALPQTTRSMTRRRSSTPPRRPNRGSRRPGRSPRTQQRNRWRPHGHHGGGHGLPPLAALAPPSLWYQVFSRRSPSSQPCACCARTSALTGRRAREEGAARSNPGATVIGECHQGDAVTASRHAAHPRCSRGLTPLRGDVLSFPGAGAPGPPASTSLRPLRNRALTLAPGSLGG